MHHCDVAYWLAVTYIPSMTPVKFRNFLTNNQTPRDIVAIQQPDWKLVDADLAWCERNNIQLITQVDPRYPTLLKELPDAPILLYVRGDTSLLNCPGLAMVGSRNPTPNGMELAEQFAYALSEAGLVITSGLALGIDAASHRGSLESKGKTIAVLGTGLGEIYPRTNRQLATKVAEQGLLVSEFPPATKAVASNFPRRNRIISGLSLGVLVVEAALRSGSLITAHRAIEQGREVFAIPGSIHNPLSRGCHALLRQGAKLVEKAEDILEELGALNAVLAKPTCEKSPVLAGEAERQVLKQVGYAVTVLDVIIQRSGLTASKVSSILLELELLNYVNVVPGGYVRVQNKPK